MSEYYTHTLIAKSKEFVAQPKELAEFLSSMISLGVVPPNPDMSVRLHNGKKMMTMTLEFGDETEKRNISRPEYVKLKHLDQIERAVAGCPRYDVEISASGQPKTPPLPIQFDQPYAVSMTCIVSPRLLSTSMCTKSGPKSVPGYGEPFDDEGSVKKATAGFFTNPHNMDGIEVPGAGCAKFWIEFTLGKFLVPPIENNNLEILNPAIVEQARRIFAQTEFSQGCNWG